MELLLIPFEKLQYCWPVTNALISKQFKTEVFKWSEELKRLGELPRQCSFRKSWLEEFNGERLEEALDALAEYLLTKLVIEASDKDLTPAQYALECALPWSHMQSIGKSVAMIESFMGTE